MSKKLHLAILVALATIGTIAGDTITSTWQKNPEPRVYEYAISRRCPAGVSKRLRHDPTLAQDAVFISEMCDDAHAYVAYVTRILGPRGNEMVCSVLRDNLLDPTRTAICRQFVAKNAPQPFCQPYLGGGCFFLDLLSKYLVIALHEILKDEMHLHCYEIHYTNFSLAEQDRIGEELRALSSPLAAQPLPKDYVPTLERGGIGCKKETPKSQ